MHRDVTLVTKKSSNKLKYLKLKQKKMKKLQKKLLYCFKRSFQLGDKKCCVIYTFPSTGFVMMKVAKALLLSLTIVQPHSFM